MCSIEVIHQEKWVARQTRLRQVSEYASAACPWPSLSRLVSALARAVTSADAVEPVAAGDHVAGDLVPGPGGVSEAEHRLIGVERADLGVRDLELDRGPGRQPGLDQVLDDLRLGVDRHPAATGQVPEVEVM